MRHAAGFIAAVAFVIAIAIAAIKGAGTNWAILVAAAYIAGLWVFQYVEARRSHGQDALELRESERVGYRDAA